MSVAIYKGCGEPGILHAVMTLLPEWMPAAHEGMQ